MWVSIGIASLPTCVTQLIAGTYVLCPSFSGQTHPLQVRRYELTEDCGCRYVLEGDGLLDEGGNGRFGGFPVSANFSSTRSLRL